MEGARSRSGLSRAKWALAAMACLAVMPLNGQTSPCDVTTLHSGIFPVGLSYSCVSSTHHKSTFESGSLPAAWTVRVTGRLEGRPDVFDTTINAGSLPEANPAVAAAFEAARQAITAAAGGAIEIPPPALVSSSTASTSATPLLDVTRATATTIQFPAISYGSNPASFGSYCVGELGDVEPGLAALAPPCAATATKIDLRFPGPGCGIFAGCNDVLHDVHTHILTEVYSTLLVTGTLTTLHYELVGVGALTIPIVLSSAGPGGSAFTSELTLTNRGTTKAFVSYSYTAAFGGSSGSALHTLPPGLQLVVPDAISFLQSNGLGNLGNAGSGGTLRITFSSLSSPDAASASVRTTTAVPAGRAGLSYPAIRASKLLSDPVYLCGLRQNATDRSNVAFLNAGASGDGDITLRLTVFSGDPADPESKTLSDVTLSPGGFAQISGILVSNGLSLGSGYVKVERVSGSAPFYAYAVINDQATSDGSFVEPVAASPASPIVSTTLPALVETFSYATELILTNFSSSPRTLRFTWVSPSLAAGQAGFSIPLLPGEQQILPAFVQRLRDRGAVTDPPAGSFAGALFAADDSGDLRGISIAARITNTSGGGRYGVFIPAFPSGSEATTAAWLYGLQQTFETRSNLALVNTGSVDDSPSTFRIDLFDGGAGADAGSLVSTVPARGFVQIDRILANYTRRSTRAWALVTRVSGNNPFLAYAVLNDGAQPGERSGDGAFVAPTIPEP